MNCYRNIKLKNIDLNDRRFYLPHLRESDVLWEGETTLYNPVWLQEKDFHKYRIVDGFLVCSRAVKKNSDMKLPARVFTVEENPLTLWKLRVNKRIEEKNLSVFGLVGSLLELWEYSEQPGAKQEINKIMQEFGIPSQDIRLSKLCRITQKSELFRSFTEIDQLSYKDIYLLAALDDKTLRELGSLLDNLSLKGNKLTTILQIISELKRGYQITSYDIMQDEEIQQILNNRPPHQRYRFIKSRLTKLRYPTLSKMQTEWQDCIRQLNLSNRMEIKHDPNFEADDIHFVIKAGSLQELITHIKQVETKSKLSVFKRLFDFI